mgnify:CR=1 FL=1
MRLNSFDLIISSKISSFKSVIKVDSDKSLSIRSFLIGAISQKVSVVKNVLESEDVKSLAISAFSKLCSKQQISPDFLIGVTQTSLNFFPHMSAFNSVALTLTLILTP